MSSGLFLGAAFLSGVGLWLANRARSRGSAFGGARPEGAVFVFAVLLVALVGLVRHELAPEARLLTTIPNTMATPESITARPLFPPALFVGLRLLLLTFAVYLLSALRGVGRMRLEEVKAGEPRECFTDIDLGQGTRMYTSGGGAALGRNSASWSTWWNIRAARPLLPPPASYGPDSLTFVGLTSAQKMVMEPAGKWFEPVAPDGIQPANLYDAQLAHRLSQMTNR